MLTLSRKAKQYLIVAAKLLIVGGAFYFIYTRIANDSQLNWTLFIDVLTKKQSFGTIAIILLLTFLNRFTEIVKWQNLARYIKPVSLSGATEQVLAALTASIFTPNGIGEYVAKTLYFEKSQAKQVIFLNLICNGIQLIIAVLFGITGLLAFNYMHPVIPGRTVIIVVGLITGLALLLLSLRKITVKGYSLQTLGVKINELPAAMHKKNMLLALLRYAAIIHQQYFLFLAFDVSLPYPVMIATVAGVYFLGSSLPTFQFLDFAVKGSVAVFFFGLLGVNEWIVVFVTTLVWFLNIVLPVTIGSYYVFRFKSGRTITAPD